VLLLTVFAQRQIVAGLTAGAVKGAGRTMPAIPEQVRHGDRYSGKLTFF
jgi:hypothetical protein